MKLVVLADNRANDGVFETEHGLSVYLETDGFTYLLDTGRSDCFIRNAARLRELSLPLDASAWQDRLLLVEDALTLKDGSCFYSCNTQRFPSPKANATLWAGDPDHVVPDTSRRKKSTTWPPG